MEAFGAFFDEEWESLSRMFSLEDSDDALLHFNGSNAFPNNTNQSSLIDESLYFTTNNGFNTNYISSQESSNSSSHTEIESIGALFSNDPTNNILQNTCDYDQSMGSYTMDTSKINGNCSSMVGPIFPDDMMEEMLQLKANALSNGQMLLGNEGSPQPPLAETIYGDSCKEMQQPKRKNEAQDKGLVGDDNSSDNPKRKRRPRPSKDGQKNKRAAPSKKNKKIVVENSNNIEEEEEEENKGGDEENMHRSSICSSDNINNNDELETTNEGSSNTCPNSNGKSRASRGSATDPQSLYARRRRERINERLRILQNLVPNGTKVDISTMLEEAVHYVKFLQLQIKLLSSDDLWMYAPIAYNGMDIGFYHKINSPNIWTPTAFHR